MLLLLLLALAGCVVGQNVNVNINSTTAATTRTVHTYPPTTTTTTATPTEGNVTNATTTTTGAATTTTTTTAGTTTTATTTTTASATTAPAGGGNNVTSNATNTSNNATNVTCSDMTSQQNCVAFGRGNDTSSTDYRACVWCGVSATDGLCREPFWSGNYSCPLETGSFWNYGCLPGDSVAACGSHCINSCETVCRDYRAPVYTITMFNDSSCTNIITPERNLTRACLPLANGGSIGVIAFANNTYSELNYMCANCRPCEPTCTNEHNYCQCTKVAGLSNLYMVIGPQGPNNCSLNGTQSGSGVNNTNTTGGASKTNSTSSTSSTTSGNSSTTQAGTTSNSASGQTPEPSQRNSAGVLTVSVAAIVSTLLLVVSIV